MREGRAEARPSLHPGSSPGAQSLSPPIATLLSLCYKKSMKRILAGLVLSMAFAHGALATPMTSAQAAMPTFFAAGHFSFAGLGAQNAPAVFLMLGLSFSMAMMARRCRSGL
jgi:hypothetical protein